MNELEQIKQELAQAVEIIAKSVEYVDMANLRLVQMIERYEQLSQQNQMLIGMHALLLHQVLYELFSRQLDPAEAFQKFRSRVINVIEKNFDQDMAAKTTEFLATVEAVFGPPAGDEDWPSFMDG
ncbi:MAG: hypothetical protein JST85_22905 [Acidobacteria bacterium]|nr:hypothetical protein [Acidobacteriota bacterium]